MSISHSTEIPTLAGGMIDMAMIRRFTKTEQRRTKIICTLGPACWDLDQLESLLDAGMNVARLNFSHGTHEGHAAVLQRVRQAAQNRNKNVAILLDTKGPEIRTGFFADGVAKLDLIKGETILLTSDYHYKSDPSTASQKKLAISYTSMAISVTPGQVILVADGSLVLTVLSTDAAAGEVSCRVENNAAIGERKNVNLPVCCCTYCSRKQERHTE